MDLLRFNGPNSIKTHIPILIHYKLFEESLGLFVFQNSAIAIVKNFDQNYF